MTGSGVSCRSPRANADTGYVCVFGACFINLGLQEAHAASVCVLQRCQCDNLLLCRAEQARCGCISGLLGLLSATISLYWQK